MVRFYGIGRVLLGGAFLASAAFMGGCTKAPNTKDMSALEEKRAAAEGAEKKLADLRLERMKLEHDLQMKQAQLQKSNADTAKSSGTVVPATTDSAKAQNAAPAPSAPKADQQVQVPDTLQNKSK